MVHPFTKKNGFTIVELLIVVVVIAILATVVIVTFRGISSQAQDAASKVLVKNFTTTLQTNQTLSGATFIVRSPWTTSETLAGSTLTRTRDQFLAENNIQGLSNKVCIDAYDQVNGNPCYPVYVDGQIPQYKKDKLYISYSQLYGGYIYAAFWYWSNAKNAWIGTTWRSGFDTANNNKPFNDTPPINENNTYRCSPDYNGNSWDFDASCRYSEPT